MAPTITGAGGLAMLAGVLLLGHIVDSYNLSDILVSGDLIKSSPLYTPIIILILLGVLQNQRNFHFILVTSMQWQLQHQFLHIYTQQQW